MVIAVIEMAAAYPNFKITTLVGVAAALVVVSSVVAEPLISFAVKPTDLN